MVFCLFSVVRSYSSSLPIFSPGIREQLLTVCRGTNQWVTLAQHFFIHSENISRCVFCFTTQSASECLFKMQLRTTKPDRSTAWGNKVYFVRKQRGNIEWCVQSEDFFILLGRNKYTSSTAAQPPGRRTALSHLECYQPLLGYCLRSPPFQ